MKKLSLLSIFILIIGCQTTKKVAIKTMEPAEVSLSRQITKIGVIDKSKPIDQTESDSQLGSIITFENQLLTKNGTIASLTGLLSELQKDKRFDTVQLLTDIPVEGKNFEAASGISWPVVQHLCEQYNVDAIFALSSYETNTQVSIKKAKIPEYGLLRTKTEVQGNEITLETLIENGWRIYDPVNCEIIDEFTLSERIISSAKGRNAYEALRSVEHRGDSLIHRSKNVGSAYGLRLKPSEKEVERAYYTRGTDNLTRANEHAINEEWQIAARLWEQEVTNENDKIASKACYNLAIYCEKQGNLAKALQWAINSQELDANRNSENYIVTLKARLAKEKILKEQFIVAKPSPDTR